MCDCAIIIETTQKLNRGVFLQVEAFEKVIILIKKHLKICINKNVHRRIPPIVMILLFGRSVNFLDLTEIILFSFIFFYFQVHYSAIIQVCCLLLFIP